MKRLLLILATTLTLGACASTPKPLRELHYIADGWVVASYDKKHKIHTQARQRSPIQYAKVIKVVGQADVKQIIVQPNDTLQSISEREYGNPYSWDIVAMANGIETPYKISPGTRLTIPQPTRQLTSAVTELDHWEIRLVNSGSQDSCVKVNFMDIDYHVDVVYGWYRIKPFQTLYLGTITQEPWELVGEVHAFDDAKWVVNSVDIVRYDEETQCDL